jgi:cytochrome c biogenesis protein ResB
MPETEFARLSRLARRLPGFLGSLRVAVVSLVLITLAAAIGGVVPQAPITPNADEIYRSFGIFWYRVITRLSFDDVFHAGWFLALVGLFALSLVLCTGRRLRKAIAAVFRRPPYAAVSEGVDGVHRIAMSGMADIEGGVRDLLRRFRMGRVDRVDDGADDIQLVARKRRWGVIAPDLVHIGILVILIGGLFGIVRQEGTFVINEWETGLRLPPCAADTAGGAVQKCTPLSYDVRVDAFGADLYEGSSRIKTYWAYLSFLQGDAIVRQGRISVNHPMTVEDFGFYPWRYGEDLQSSLVRLHVFESNRKAVTSEIALRIGETVAVPGTELWLTAVHFYQTFALTADGEPIDLGDTPGGYSAVLLQVTGVDVTGKVVAYHDLALPFTLETSTAHPMEFVLADAVVPAFVEVRYARSPGYPIVWWGSILVMVGLAGTFYLAPRQIRVSIRVDCIVLQSEGRRPVDRLSDLVEAIRRHCEEKTDRP